VVGGHDHERFGITFREALPDLDGLVELPPGLDEESRIALVGHLVYSLLLDHQEEAFMVLREGLDGLLRHLGKGDWRAVDYSGLTC
jgi:hypothetical protein